MDYILSSNTDGLMRKAPVLTRSLAALGGIWASYQAYKLASFTWLQFLRPIALHRYRQDEGGEPWALVTGASAGIGKGFAYELASRGFNVVLHGRNEKKLNGIINDLKQEWPTRSFRCLILDIITDVNDIAKMQAAVGELKDLNLRILVNNIAGGEGDGPLWLALQDMPAHTVDDWIDATSRFPTQLTRLLLPQMTRHKPGLILNIGSGISEMPAPFLSVYSGAKAFNMAWSRSLAVELQAQGYDIEVIGILVGIVATEKVHRPASLSAPTPRRMASSCLRMAGSGHRIVWAYWMHAIEFGLGIGSLPSSVVEWLATKIAKEGMEKEQSGGSP